MSDFRSWAAWVEYRDRRKGPGVWWAHQNKQDSNRDLVRDPATGEEREAEVPFDRSRNAEKRSPDPTVRRNALLERMARRRRESWKREKNRKDIARAVLGGSQL